MSRQTRRTRSPSFKAKVALTAVRGDSGSRLLVPAPASQAQNRNARKEV